MAIAMEDYTDVRVVGMYDTYLTDGTGYGDGDPNHLTYLECGPFKTSKLPQVGKDYIVSGQDGPWQLKKTMRCSFSGPQSRFRILTDPDVLARNAFTAANATTFHVTNNTNGQLGDQSILVFLTPLLNSKDYKYAAWQQLTPGEGATQPFTLSQDISTYVTINNGTTSAHMPILPGELSSVTNPHGLSPVIGSPSRSSSVTPQQCGLQNNTSPYEEIFASWLVNNNLVVASSVGVTEGALSTFELQTKLYWAIGAASTGPNYTLQEITPMQSYSLPAGTTDVTVNVTFNTSTGTYEYDFNPKSL